MREMDFGECLRRSKASEAQSDDADVIRLFFEGDAASVREASLSEDKQGIDYVATLSSGREVRIDAKRRYGCAQYWPGGVPEFTLEEWSSRPEAGEAGRVGWALDAKKQTDYILFTWPEDECSQRHIVPFQMLRKAFETNLSTWRDDYKYNARQPNRWQGRRWLSSCVFVPAPVVWRAIYRAGSLDVRQPRRQRMGQLTLFRI